MLSSLLEKTIKIVIFVGMIAATGLTFFQSIFRHVGELNFPGANELILLSVVWVYFIGMAYGTLKNENIQGGMEDLIKSIPLRKALAVTSSFLSAGFAITATYYSTLLLKSSVSQGYESIYYGMPDYYWVSSLFVGFVLTSLFFVKTFLTQCSIIGK
jgi:TRAP-type C4-dicarboxylate transport system permease small subunit